MSETKKHENISIKNKIIRKYKKQITKKSMIIY